jgi:hypothetical protein
MSTQPDMPGSTNVRRVYYLIGLAGAALLLLGVFMPAIRRALDRDRLYVEYFVPEAVILLVCVAVSLFLMKRRKLRRLAFTGALALCVLSFSYFRNEHQKRERISKAYDRIYIGELEDREDKIDPELRKAGGKFREAMADLIRSGEEEERYRTGWVVMIAGSLLILGAGLMAYPSIERRVLTSFALFEQAKKKCPSCAGLNVAEAVKCKYCGGRISG